MFIDRLFKKVIYKTANTVATVVRDAASSVVEYTESSNPITPDKLEKATKDVEATWDKVEKSIKEKAKPAPIKRDKKSKDTSKKAVTEENTRKKQSSKQPKKKEKSTKKQAPKA